MGLESFAQRLAIRLDLLLSLSLYLLLALSDARFLERLTTTRWEIDAQRLTVHQSNSPVP